MPSKKIAIIVPAYNEEESIGAVLKQLRGLVPAFKKLGITLSILVINDGSTDHTEQLARAEKADAVINHHMNRGLGAAVRSGLAAAQGMGVDMAVKFDADLQHDPNDIIELIRPILEGRADLVYGERFSNMEYRMPFIRRIGNLVFTRMMAWLTRWPVRDSQPGIFAVNEKYLARFDIPGDYNYTQQILMDAYLKGMRFEQVPVSFRRRKTGHSFVSLIYPLKVIAQLVMVLCISRPLSFFFPIGFSSFLLGAIVFVYQISLWLMGQAPKPVTNVNFVLGSMLFGMQTIFFGLLAQLIVATRKS
jgi:glycosyltransferase involved in cell wall biosynthesis